MEYPPCVNDKKYRYNWIFRLTGWVTLRYERANQFQCILYNPKLIRAMERFIHIEAVQSKYRTTCDWSLFACVNRDEIYKITTARHKTWKRSTLFEQFRRIGRKKKYQHLNLLARLVLRLHPRSWGQPVTVPSCGWSHNQHILGHNRFEVYLFPWQIRHKPQK